jgi:putative oxidoreductase
MNARFMNITHVLLRVVAGFLFLCHGGQKLFGWFGGMGPSGGTVELTSLMGVAGMLEFFGGLAILVGFLTKPFAFLLAGEMAWAYFTVHQPNGQLPIQNHGEPAALFAFIFLFLATHGAGGMSVDAAVAHARRERSTAKGALRRRSDEPFPGQAA